MTRQRARSTGWLVLAITGLAMGSLLLSSGAVFAEQPAGLQCPDGWVSKDESGADDNAYVPPAGLLICVKAGSTQSNDGEGNTGIIETDGVTTLQGYLQDAGIVGGDGTARDVSHWVRYPFGTLTIEKVTGEDTETIFGFSGTFDEEAIEAFDLGDGDSKIFGELGTYVITEAAVEGWYLADIDCGEAEVELIDSTVEVTIADGDHVTCTFTNAMVATEREAVLTVVKDADGNTIEEFEFLDGDAALKGGESFFIELEDADFDESDEVVVDIWETLTTAQEAALWELVDIDCDTHSFEVAEDGTLTVSLMDGDDVTCTFYNEQGTPEVGALLSLEKAVPGAAADATEFGFTLAGVALSSTVSEADAPVVLANMAGTYVIAENALSGWNLSGIDCTGNATAETVTLAARSVSVSVANGENVVCTFTNTQPTGQVLPGNPTPTPSATPSPAPTVRGAVLPSTAMPASGVDATLVGMLLLMGSGGIGVVSLLGDRKR